MRISALASLPQYWRHLAPIVAELERQGHEVDVWARVPGSSWGPTLGMRRDRIGPWLLVAGYTDARLISGRQVIYVEHGAGQTYETEIPRLRVGYSGSEKLDNVRLFICPNGKVRDRWLARYPASRAVVTGDPALDGLRSRRAEKVMARPGPEGSRSVRARVAVTSHWQMGGDELPEGMPALPHYEHLLPELAARYDLIGHAHPKIAGPMERMWRALGVPFEPDPDVILTEADLLIGDNTSLLYEAAAVDLPVLVLNAPWYRREVEHGLRFWSTVPGLQCDNPENLITAIDTCLADPPDLSALRRTAVSAVYDAVDGAAARAAAAIIELEGAPMPEVQSNEIQDRLEELIRRIYQLGGTDALAEQIRDQWDHWSPVERDRMRRLNDVRLRAEILLATQDEAEGDPFPDVELPSEDEMNEQAALLLDNPEAGEILEVVGDDDELAFRLFQLETQRAGSRVGLLEALAAVAGIEYEPAGA